MRITAWRCAAVALVLAGIGAAAGAQEAGEEGPAAFSFILGPRIGTSYTMMSPAAYSSYVSAVYPAGDYFPVNALFGVNFEQRILLGETRSHFAFQEVVILGGLEQSIALPSASFLIGYRDSTGFEVGIGPTVSFSGIAVLAAIGWTISARGVYVPIDISATIPSAKAAATVALTTGFNFVISRQPARR